MFSLEALAFGGDGEHFWAEGRYHFRGKLLDEFLEEGGEMHVSALELVFRVGEEGFEVVVGGWNAVDEIFEDKSESDERGISYIIKGELGENKEGADLWRSS